MIRYYIDSIDLSSLGITVSQAKGLFGLPKVKNALTISYPNRHGILVDLANPIYDVRSIELHCHLSASTRMEFLIRTNELVTTLFAKPNLRELRIDYDSQKPLFYYVYPNDGIAIERESKWDASRQLGQFTLKLLEPEPLKRVFIFEADNVQNSRHIQLAFDEPNQQFTVYWGDGSYDVVRAGSQIEHEYSTDGRYYISIVGMVNDIGSLTASQNLVVLWNLL